MKTVRSLLRRPMTTCVMVITLSVDMAAVGVMAALFGSVLFPALPYDHPGELITLWSSARPGSIQQVDYLTPKRIDGWLQSPPQLLDQLSAVGSSSGLLRVGDATNRVAVAAVSGSFFPMLGVQPSRGRLLNADDNSAGTPPAALLSDRAWRQYFQADPEVIGSAVTIDSVTYTIVGVAPLEMDYPRGTDVWLPRAHIRDRNQPVAWLLIGRLRPGSALEAARAEIIAKSQIDNRTDSIAYGGLGVTVVPLVTVERSLGQGIMPLIGMCLAALYLISALNLGILLLLQTAARAREFAVRAALGAGTWGALRPLLAEVGLQFVVGGAIALIGAVSTMRYIRARYLFQLAPLTWRAELIAVAAVVLLVLLTASLLVPLVFRRARAADLYVLLRRSGETLTSDAQSRRARRWLVGAEIAVAIMLACAAGITGKSLRYFRGIDAGFDADRVVVARPDYTAVSYDERRQISLAEETRARLSSVREVSDFTYWRRIPQSFPPPPIERVLSIQGTVGPLEGHRRLYWFYEVGPRFFETLGLRLLEGRVFDLRDQRASQPVAVINSTAAERWWPNESALGKRVSLNPQDPAAWVIVVGVVEGASLDAIDRQQVARDIRRPQLYRPLTQGGELAAPYWMWDTSCAFCAKIAIAARASTDADLAGRALRQAIAYVDPGMPLGDVITMYDEQLGRAGWAGPMLQRNARTVGSFATVALLLAMLGVYGVVADSARARTRELSIRLALGATPLGLLRMLLRENVLLAVSSIALGGLLYWNLSRVAGGLLFGGQYLPLLFKQSALDPGIIAAVLLVAMFVITIAVATGSRRALTLDPREGLHTE